MNHSTTSTLMREVNDTLVTDWIFSEDVQKILGISKRTLYRYVSEGILPCYKPTGGRLFFKRSDVENLISGGLKAS